MLPPALPRQPYLRPDADGSVIVDVHVMPNAAKTLVQGLHDGALRLRLKAPPVEGKANLALQAWLAEELGIPRHAIELLRGQTARRKQLRIAQAYAERADWQRLAPPDS